MMGSDVRQGWVAVWMTVVLRVGMARHGEALVSPHHEPRSRREQRGALCRYAPRHDHGLAGESMEMLGILDELR